MMFEAMRGLFAPSGPLIDGDGHGVRFESKPPMDADQRAACERALNRELPEEYALFLSQWNGVDLYRTGSERPRLRFLGTDGLLQFAAYPYVTANEAQWGVGSGRIFACVHAPATDGADFLGYDLTSATFVDLYGYEVWHTIPTRTLARNLDEFLTRFINERFTYFWTTWR